VRVAGICDIGADVETLEVGDPRALAADEVLIEVRTAGVGNWDEIVRTGGWDVGASPPMALGVETAEAISAVGMDVKGFGVGDEVLCHPVPLRDQGGWAQLQIVPIGSIASKPANMSWDIAGVFPIPVLTAEQVVSEALALKSGESLLVHGAGGSTGGMIVQLAALRGVDVIATCSPGSADRVRSYGLKMLTPRRCRIEEAANALTQVVAGRARGGMVIAFRWHP
jgi:NADPH:quinone reductase-like Zn-dependent oxidoreductase